MRYYTGLDVSLDKTNICVVDEQGATVCEGETPSDATAIGDWLRQREIRPHRVGLEAGMTCRVLQRSLAHDGLPAVCIDSRHAHKVLSARLNKTDRNDARGIAELIRTNMFKRVHIKSLESQKALALLTARKILSRKRQDIKNAIGALLREFGLKLGRVGKSTYHEHVCTLVEDAPYLADSIGPLLSIWSSLGECFTQLDEQVSRLAKADPVCRRLMTTPGVGPLVALTYKTVIDDPTRFKRSRTVGAYLGLTPKSYQSGVVSLRGRVSRWGDKNLRAALANAAMVILTPRCRPTALKLWAEQIVVRRGRKRAIVALARRLAVILHHIWIEGAEFRVQP